MTLDQFFCNVQLKQIFNTTDRQSLNCLMTLIFTLGPAEKKKTKKKNMKIGAFIFKLWLNIQLKKLIK